MSASTTSNSTSDSSIQLNHFSSTAASTARKMDKAGISTKKSKLSGHVLSVYWSNEYLSEVASSLFSSDCEDKPLAENKSIVHVIPTSKFLSSLNHFVFFIHPILIVFYLSRGYLLYQYD